MTKPHKALILLAFVLTTLTGCGGGVSGTGIGIEPADSDSISGMPTNNTKMFSSLLDNVDAKSKQTTSIVANYMLSDCSNYESYLKDKTNSTATTLLNSIHREGSTCIAGNSAPNSMLITVRNAEIYECASSNASNRNCKIRVELTCNISSAFGGKNTIKPASDLLCIGEHTGHGSFVFQDDNLIGVSWLTFQ